MVTPSSYRLTTAARTRGKKLFSERVVKLWNSLPSSIVNFSSLATFRKRLNKISLRIYTELSFYLLSYCFNLSLFDTHVSIVLDFTGIYRWLAPLAADV